MLDALVHTRIENSCFRLEVVYKIGFLEYILFP